MSKVQRGNLLAPIEFERRAEEFVEILAAGPSPDEARVERIVSQGHVSPEGFWYDQDQQEWVAVIQGEAELEFEDGFEGRRESLKMTAGEWLLIPAHARHRVTHTSTEPPACGRRSSCLRFFD